MKTKIIALALLAALFTACSNDDEPTPVSQEELCDCEITRYKVYTGLDRPIDTVYVGTQPNERDTCGIEKYVSVPFSGNIYWRYVDKWDCNAE